MSARGLRRLAIRSDIRAAALVGVVAAALCVELNGVDGWSDDAFASRAAADTAPLRQGVVAEPAMLTKIRAGQRHEIQGGHVFAGASLSE